MKTYFLLIAFISISISVSAQNFIQNEKKQKNSFTQMQRQFGEWKKTHNLKIEKNLFSIIIKLKIQRIELR